MKSPTFFSKAGDFRQWLKDNSGEATELLVGFHKVDSGRPSMSWSESVDEALCFGWIDGVRRRIDDTRYSIRFTPRKPGSIWSAVNIDKVGKLRSEGLMTSAGEEAFSNEPKPDPGCIPTSGRSPPSLIRRNCARSRKARWHGNFLKRLPLATRRWFCTG